MAERRERTSSMGMGMDRDRGGDRGGYGGGGGDRDRGGYGGGDRDRGDRGDRDGGDGKDSGFAGRRFGRRRVCRFCVDKIEVIDFKDVNMLRYFITERGRIVPARISGNCASHQRKVARTVRQSRQMGLMPFVADRV